MNASSITTAVRRRIITIGLAFALIATLAASYPHFSTKAGESASTEVPALAGPMVSPGGGGGSGGG